MKVCAGDHAPWAWLRRILLKVDVGLGRCGVRPDSEEAVRFAENIAGLAGIDFRGILTHAGQVYSAEGRGKSERLARVKDISRLERDEMLRFAYRLVKSGIAVKEISIGSTPTAWNFEQFPLISEMGTLSITEIRPGNYVFHDRNQVNLGVAAPEQCALTVLATVVSRPAPDRVILDAGSKTISKESGAHGYGAVEGYGELFSCDPGRSPVAGAGPVFGLSEEHDWVRVSPECPLQVGDVVQVLPNHACAAVNLSDFLLIAENGIVVDCWPIDARGKSQ